MAETYTQEGLRVAEPGLVRIAHIVYALHAVSVVIGIGSAAVSVVGAFVFGWIPLAAIVLNYWNAGRAKGTLVESHFRWQIRTFWYTVLWMALAFLVSAPLMLVLVGFLLWPFLLALLGLWVCYRVIRGWLTLRDGRPMAV